MIGDPTLFIRTDEVEQAWKIVDPYLEAWKDPARPALLPRRHVGSSRGRTLARALG